MSWDDSRSLEELSLEATFYASFFDNARSRKFRGLLIKVLEETPEEVKRQASVSAIYYSYFPLPGGQTVCRPDGWFTSACRRYAQPGAAIPVEVRSWSETNLSLEEIQRRMKEGSRLPSEVGFGEAKVGSDDLG